VARRHRDPALAEGVLAWDYEYENRSNVVDSYIRLLRNKIDRPFGSTSLETVRGAGYRLREDGGG
jgi:two-component system OmpR family response regulator